MLRQIIKLHCQTILTTTTAAGALTFVPGLVYNQYQHGDFLNFYGTFTVTSVRHLGKFRNPNAEQNWITVIEAVTPFSSEYINPMTNTSGQQIFTSAEAGD